MSIGTSIRQTLRTATSVRTKGHDLDTTEGRSAERYRRAALASWVNIASRVIYTGVLFIAIRVVANSTTSTELGLWLLLVGAVALVGFADFGIGNGLLNVVADAHGRDDIHQVRQAISSAFVALISVSVVIGAGFWALAPHIPWNSFLNISGIPEQETSDALRIFVLCIVVGLPLGISQRVRHALQEGWIANLWLAIGSLISLVLIVATDLSDASIADRVAAMLVGPPIAFLVDSVILFGYGRRDLRPRWSEVTTTATWNILRQGSMFFLLATVAAFSYEADSLIISHYLGADQVETYAVPFRLFALAPSLVLVVVTPLWPAYGEAIARGDLGWVHRTVRRTLVVAALLTGPVSIILFFTSPWIISVWIGGEISPPSAVLAGLALWAVLNGVSTALAMFFNGAGILRLQVAMAIVMGGMNVIVSIRLVQTIGVAGPIWGTVLTQITLVLFPIWLLLRNVLDKRTGPTGLAVFVQRWTDTPSTPFKRDAPHQN